MPTQEMTITQQQLAQQAINQLMIIGGKLTNDDDITFEGTAFKFPEMFRGDLPGIKSFIDRYVKGQLETVYVEKTFEFRPNDGAHATYQCLKTHFGYAQGKSRMGIPPSEITVSTGFVNGEEVFTTVPWGDMVLPTLIDATLTITSERTRDRGTLFKLAASCRRIQKEAIDGFFIVVEKYLKEHSLYKGKAVYGDMSFIDTEKIDPSQFVYSEDVWADAETLIFSPMRDSAVLTELEMEQKRVILLEGPYGTGKSGLGRTSAKEAHDNGWTAIICRPGVDNPFDVLQTARLYQPCLLFIEDIDVISVTRDPSDVTRLLDAFDGFGTKDLQMIVVITTNHADKIHKGMLRPGRISGTISIGAMDRPGVEKLAKIVVGDALEDDIDFDAVYEATEGYMPAYVREGLERAVRYSVARLRKVGKIATIDLVRGLHSLRAQLKLQDQAEDRMEKLPTFDRVFRQAINETVETTIESAVGNIEIPSTYDIAEEVDNRVRSILDSTTVLDQNDEVFGRLDT